MKSIFFQCDKMTTLNDQRDLQKISYGSVMKSVRRLPRRGSHTSTAIVRGRLAVPSRLCR